MRDEAKKAKKELKAAMNGLKLVSNLALLGILFSRKKK